MADSIAVMNAGHIEQLGDPADALREPGDDVRRQLPRPVQPAASQHRPVRAEGGTVRVDLTRQPTSRSHAIDIPDGSDRHLDRGPPGEAPDRPRAVAGQLASRGRHRRLLHGGVHPVPRPDAVGPGDRRSSSRTTGRRPGPGGRDVGCPGTPAHAFVLDADQAADAGGNRDPTMTQRRRASRDRAIRRAPPTRQQAAQLGDPYAAARCPASLWLCRVLRPADDLARLAVAADRRHRQRLRADLATGRPTPTRCPASGRSWCGRCRLPRAATVLTLLFGYPLAWFIAHRSGRWKNFLLVLVIAPFFTSFLIRTLAWQNILGNSGLLTEVAGWVPFGWGTGALDGFKSGLHAVGLISTDQLMNSVVRRDLRADLQLPAVHGAAALRQPRAARPAAGRGGPGPLRLARPDLPQGHPGRCRCRVSSRGRCSPSSRPPVTTSTPVLLGNTRTRR